MGACDAAPGTASRRSRARRAVLTGCSWAAVGSVGYAAGGPVLAAAGLAAAAVTGVALAVILQAMLGRSDARSPFERLMLVLCVLRGRLPRDQLPPATAQDGKAATLDPAMPTVAVTQAAGEPGSDLPAQQAGKPHELDVPPLRCRRQVSGSRRHPARPAAAAGPGHGQSPRGPGSAAEPPP